MRHLKRKHLYMAILAAGFVFIALPAHALSGEQVDKLLANDGAEGDFFGYSVSVSGDTAVIGARTDDDLGDSSGAAYVFVRSGNSWTQQTKLHADDGAAGDQFGFSVAVSGGTAVVGAMFDDDRGLSSGSAYVFVRSGTSWTQQTKLNADDSAAGDQFGFSVAVSGDTAVVGAFGDDDLGAGSGAAYVFERTGIEWVQQDKLLAEDGAAGDQFGIAVAVSGVTAVIGASTDADLGAFSGSAYVFVRVVTSWVQQDKLLADDGAFGDNFGLAVAVSGNTVVVGARGHDELGSDAGSAYVFVRDGASWTQQAELLAEDGAQGDNFGHAVAVDGGTAVIGAAGNDDLGDSSGSAYMFVGNGATWTQKPRLTADDGAAGDQFGFSVAVSGGAAVLGAWQDADLGADSGSAYVFSVERFNDVPPGYWAFSFIERLAASGITAGCGNGNYCPADAVTRAQMAVFLERGMNGSAFVPPAASGNVFVDVPAGSFAASFIEQLFQDGITAGCGGNSYCPDAIVTRAQMAVFLLRAKYGSAYMPPPATGFFPDAPLGSFAVAWIEQLAAEGITAGCGNGNYCPEAAVARDQMAVFLVRTFSLPTVLKSGTVNLTSGTGYDFSAGTSGGPSHGDFYFLNQSGVSRFWANNFGMQGLVDVGVTAGALQRIAIPASGYNLFGVEAIDGHSYVSKAVTTEPDHYIVFRVTAVSAADATLDWVYVTR